MKIGSQFLSFLPSSKAYVNLAIIRSRTKRKKLQSVIDSTKRDVVHELEMKEDNVARSKAAQILRDEALLVVLGNVELHLEQLSVRMNDFLLSGKPLPCIQQAVDTLLYVAPRIGIKEIQELANEWTIKFGMDYKNFAVTNKFNTINPAVIEQLAIIPGPEAIDNLLWSLGTQYKINTTEPKQRKSDVPELSKERGFEEITCKDSFTDIPVPTFAGFDEATEAHNVEFPQLSFDQLPLPPIHEAVVPDYENLASQDILARCQPSRLGPTFLDELEHRLAQHTGKGITQVPPMVTMSSADLVLPDVPHTSVSVDPDTDTDDFDLPEITPGHSSFTSSIRVVTHKNLSTNIKAHSQLPELDELSSRLNALKKK